MPAISTTRRSWNSPQRPRTDGVRAPSPFAVSVAELLRSDQRLHLLGEAPWLAGLFDLLNLAVDFVSESLMGRRS
jgi:hypothetical protein